MSWVKLDTGIFRNPKIVTIGGDAKLLYIAGICYAGEHQTNATIPGHQIPYIADEVGVRNFIKARDELLDADLWELYYGSVIIIDGVRVFRDVSSRPSQSVWKRIREVVFHRDDYTCQYCGERGGRLECDHVLPVSRGGGHSLSNLVTACFRCNRSKLAKTVEEWQP